MPVPQETIRRLADIPNVTVSEGPLLSRYTRFGIGGPADIFAETSDPEAYRLYLKGREFLVGTDAEMDKSVRLLPAGGGSRT